MRLFTITDTASLFKLVAIEQIVLSPDITSAEVHISRWSDYDYYIQHGNDFTPLSRDVVHIDITERPRKLTDFIYEKVAETLPPHEIIYSRPRE
ncbi:hypothetical protein P9057_01415 [Gallibacterium anatis]|uniref:hypothetical protein n=1 Tax=Gallibacterium anatis TaxID=750 RepID=UPI003005A723